jgi:glucose-6-phosphate 1-dehydrogenase
MYRIDHYLGKEMIRNVLAIRFANRIFSESWHGGAVESVELTSVETAGVEERLDYYDRAGAINDMVQSHLLQMLALVAMEAPDTFEAEPVRRRKLEVLERVSLDPLHLPVAGQYAGYRELLPASLTETAVEATLRIESPRWQGTRFRLRTGKRLMEKRTEIRLRFRPTRLCLDCVESLEAEANELVVEIFPEEGIRFAFNSKVPGYSFDLEKVIAEYCHSCRVIGNKPEAYVKLLKDALAGDTTLFTSFAELQAQWRIADRIRAAARAAGLVVYPVGAVRVGHGGGGSC